MSSIGIIPLGIEARFGDSKATRANFASGVKCMPKKDPVVVEFNELLLSLSGIFSLVLVSLLKGG